MTETSRMLRYDVRNDGIGPYAVFYCDKCEREYRSQPDVTGAIAKDIGLQAASVAKGIANVFGLGGVIKQVTEAAQQARAVSARCPNDGTLAPAGTKFCPKCGATMIQPQAAKCPKCGADTQGAKFCPECGTKVEPAPAKCPSCGAETKGAKFCPECGTKLIS